MADDTNGGRKPIGDGSLPPDGRVTYGEGFDGFAGASGPPPSYAPPNNGRSPEAERARRELADTMGKEHAA